MPSWLAPIVAALVKFFLDLVRGKMETKSEEVGALKAEKTAQESINQAQQTAIEVRDEVDRDPDIGTTIDRL